MANTDLHRLKLSLPVIEQEITNLLAALYQDNPELKQDDDFKSDILEGSTDLLEVLNMLLFDLILTESYLEGSKITRARVEQREKKLKGRQEVIRNILKRLLTAAEMRKITVPNGTISLSAKPLSVEILDEGLIPDELMRIKREPNKTLIGEKLKAGESVPGATLSNGGETITIR